MITMKDRFDALINLSVKSLALYLLSAAQAVDNFGYK